MNTFLISSIICLFSITSFAQGGNGPGDGTGPCAQDVQTHCGNIERGQGRMMECMKTNKEKFSEACKTHMAEMKEAHKEMRKEMREKMKAKRKELKKDNSAPTTETK